MKTLRFIGTTWALYYCPRCKVVYYAKEECPCDTIENESETEAKNV